MSDIDVIKARHRLCGLFSLYGSVLSVIQQRIMHLRMDEDLSYQEIADLGHGTRQAVHEAVKSATRRLENMETKLGFHGRINEQRKLLQAMDSCDDLVKMKKFIRKYENVLSL